MRRATLALVLAVALALAGCGGNPRPKSLPTDSPTSSSSSPSPTEARPTVPAAAKVKDKDGALAMAKAFIKAVNYSGKTGTTGDLRSMYVSHCTRCEALADGIDATYAAGGSFKGGDWSPTRFKFYSIDGDVAYVDVVVDTSSQTWIEKSGSEPRRFRATRNVLKAFNLRWASRGWRVSALDPDR